MNLLCLVLRDSRSEASPMERSRGRLWIRKILSKSRRRTSERRMSINVLPEDVLLEIFHQYLDEDSSYRNIEKVDEWQTLVHVCRRWRNVIFGSPRSLNLHLLCDGRRHVKEILDVWPPFPIIIQNRVSEMVKNIIPALEHHDRVRQILLDDISSSDLENVLAVMQEPFPALTHLQIQSEHNVLAPVVPDSFLGGSTPLLQYLELNCVPFPGLPKLLLSANHLVTLYLWHIPHSGYISPEVTANALSASTRLETFWLQLRSPRSRPDRDRRRPPPRTRSILPALTHFVFEGVSEYLEDLVAQINAPQLNRFDIRFFHQLIFDTPQLSQFISRTPNFMACNEARVLLNPHATEVTLPSLQKSYKALELRISCAQSDWQLSSLAQICSSSLPLMSSLERLYFKNEYESLDLQGDIENVQWLELLHPFTAVKNLYLSSYYAPRIMTPALQALTGERAAEVLPALRNLFLDYHPSRPVLEAIEKFVATRQLSGHPIAVSRWNGWG